MQAHRLNVLCFLSSSIWLLNALGGDHAQVYASPAQPRLTLSGAVHSTLIDPALHLGAILTGRGSMFYGTAIGHLTFVDDRTGAIAGRPVALTIGPSGDTLAVVDTRNHRIIIEDTATADGSIDIIDERTHVVTRASLSRPSTFDMLVALAIDEHTGQVVAAVDQSDVNGNHVGLFTLAGTVLKPVNSINLTTPPDVQVDETVEQPDLGYRGFAVRVDGQKLMLLPRDDRKGLLTSDLGSPFSLVNGVVLGLVSGGGATIGLKLPQEPYQLIWRQNYPFALQVLGTQMATVDVPALPEPFQVQITDLVSHRQTLIATTIPVDVNALSLSQGARGQTFVLAWDDGTTTTIEDVSSHGVLWTHQVTGTSPRVVVDRTTGAILLTVMTFGAQLEGDMYIF